MAPNSNYCGDGGRQSMMNVPSLVLTSTDNPDDIEVLCSGKKNINLESTCVNKPPTVPEMMMLPPPTTSNRKKWVKNDSKCINIKTFGEKEVHDRPMEGSEHGRTKPLSKSSSNIYANKNVTPFIIRRSPLKQLPRDKNEDVSPTQYGEICKLNFNRISVSDESEGSIITPTSPAVHQVFFSSEELENKNIPNVEETDTIFDDVNLNSPPNTVVNQMSYSELDGVKNGANSNSVKQDDKFYSITGEDWPPIDLTPQQEEERYKVFCDQHFRECGGVTPVIGGPSVLTEGAPYNHSHQKIISTCVSTRQGNQQCNLVEQSVDSYSCVTPPAQTRHTMAFKQNDDPTPSPSHLCMQVGSSEALPLWATPFVIKEPYAQVAVCNPISKINQKDSLDHPQSNKDIGNSEAPPLWSTPDILKADPLQKVVLRTPAVQSVVYSCVPQGSQYNSLIRCRNLPANQTSYMEEKETELEEEKSTSTLSYMEVITNIFKGIFGGPLNFDFPVIYPHYEVAKGIPTVDIDKKNN